MDLKIEVDGEIVNCDIISVFKDDNTNIDYVIYTDNVIDENGDKNLFASRYKLNNNDVELLEIENEEEWELIEDKIRGINEYE